jgi:zinc-ribbon domain
MNIRDDTLVCGYCGEKIPQKSQKPTDSAGKRHLPSGSATQKAGLPAKEPSDEGDAGEEEEEGGLSPYLQSGEQVLIGSLNVSVKKFFFHAYMTDRRIFLIDTQEKKLKVTAKDVPRSTLAGSIIEFSENSDPVLVLSIRSPDDEIKTMKIVFVQNGMDRSAEIDEWIALLHKEDEQRARPQRAAAAERQKPEPEQPPALPKANVKNQELRPAKKPVKDLEKQPPVKRLISFTKAPETQPSPEVQPVTPPRRTQVRQVTESGRKAPLVADPERDVPHVPHDNIPSVKKPEVHSAMKVAMKSAMKPLAQPQVRQGKRDIPDHVMRRPVVEPETTEPAEPLRRPKIQEKVHEPLFQEPPFPEEPAEVPQFCHNCGKKLPLEANFCPGCGTRLGQNRTLTNTRVPTAPREKRALPADTVPAERRPASLPRTEEPDEDDFEDEKPQPTKPPLKKAPRGSEMTILHKFLRR